MTSNEISQLETITTLERLGEIEGDLDQLSASANVPFYQETSFLIPWYTMANELGQKPYCVALWHRDGRLIGFVPLCRRRDPKALFAHRLSTPRIGSSPPFDIVVAPDINQSAAIAAIADTLLKATWIDLQLPQTLRRSAFMTFLAPALRGKGQQLKEKDATEYFFVGQSSSKDDYYGQFKSKRRVELKRLMKRFDQNAESVKIDDPAELDKAFNWIAVILENSWKNKGYLRKTFLPLLRQQLDRALSEQQAYIRFAVVDGAPIGFLVEFVDRNGTLNAYYNAHNPAHNALAPGMNLLHLGVLDGIERQSPCYLCWSDRPYIRRLAVQSEDVITLEIQRSGPVAALCNGAVRFVGHLRRKQPKPKRA